MTNAYEQFCQLLLCQLRMWKLAHPNANVVFQWNFTEKTGVIATIGDAIENKFVSVNKEGLDMLKELGWTDRIVNAPTVFQVKAVIDIAYGRAHAPK